MDKTSSLMKQSVCEVKFKTCVNRDVKRLQSVWKIHFNEFDNKAETLWVISNIIKLRITTEDFQIERVQGFLKL